MNPNGNASQGSEVTNQMAQRNAVLSDNPKGNGIMTEVLFTGTLFSANVDADWLAKNAPLMDNINARITAICEQAAPVKASIADHEAALKAERERVRALATESAPVIVELRAALGYTSGPRPAVLTAAFEALVEHGVTRSRLEDAIKKLRDEQDPSRVALREAVAEKRRVNKSDTATAEAGAPDMVKADKDLVLSYNTNSTESIAQRGDAEFTEADAILLIANAKTLADKGKSIKATLKASAKVA